MSESKPTAGAMRAARRIYLDAGKIRRVEEMAEAIDRETGLPELFETLRYIALIGGNLPDERLTDATGPNDARHRGLMVCEARRIARECLAKLEGKP